MFFIFFLKYIYIYIYIYINQTCIFCFSYFLKKKIYEFIVPNFVRKKKSNIFFVFSLFFLFFKIVTK